MKPAQIDAQHGNSNVCQASANSYMRLLAFYGAYLKLLHAEATTIGMVLDADFDVAALVYAHNIINTAKSTVVREYLGLKVVSIPHA